ncbi:putative pectinesterase [Rosa chinensis]|uniref:pectinesterase n=1 Tax=Rosa chinensis TaxID=74649 RepID=A0A2P6QJ34_ROSCH|nr:putative pectinesterase 11 [Rosa chinensis]PRQ34173.1 putative pectinesterase [Rosa chinensis]
MVRGTFMMNLVFIALYAFMAISNSQAEGTNTSTSAILITVDQSGKGDYKKIQEAIDSVASNNAELVFIRVKPGVYEEKVMVPADKPFITISGTKAADTVITWNDSGDIFESPTFSVLASDFIGRYLTIQNTYGAGVKAVALRVSGDRAAFYGCRILSHQDTLLDDTGRHYYNNCYIEGDVDFICGNAASFFEKCHLHSLSVGTGAITAQRRMSPAEDTGFMFFGCKITGVKTAVLGRPWGTYSRVVFVFTYMTSAILPQGWDDWGNSADQLRTVYYGQYKCSGRGATTSKRVEWARDLTSEEVEPFLTKDMIDANAWLRSAPTSFKKKALSANDTKN